MTASEAKFETRADLGKGLVYCRVSGILGEAEMKKFCDSYRRHGTQRFLGKKHMVLVDMRGMKTLRPSVALLLVNEIAHARVHGVVLCAHLSDDAVQRLQMRRLVRQAATEDITVEVASYEEAERVLARAHAPNRARRD